MAVRESLLGILTLGPAYGLQLHYELGSRAPHRAQTNVGQIYGTLERLTKAGLVEQKGQTQEGLPLYRLTPTGVSEANNWLEGSDIDSNSPVPEWPEILDRVLISRSVRLKSATVLIGRLEKCLDDNDSPATTLSDLANSHFRDAAKAWLDDAKSDQANTDIPYASNRPKRGRPKA